MSTLGNSDLQEAQQLVAEIRQGLENFYYTGMRLMRLREPKLYGALGYATFEACVKGEFEWDRKYAYRLIQAADYRSVLPDVAQWATSQDQVWTERTVRELTRLESKKDAARVAVKALKMLQQNAREAAKNPEVKPLKLTASFVRKYVDADLGIDRAAQAKETREQRELERTPELYRFLDDMTGRLTSQVRKLNTVVDNKEAWTLLREEYPDVMKRFVKACDSLADLVRRVGR